MTELVFEVTQEADGGFVAECLTEAFFTQADSWGQLRSNVREAVAATRWNERSGAEEFLRVPITIEDTEPAMVERQRFIEV